MSLRALSDYTFYSRYARYNSVKKRRETWQESVARVYDMHREKYADAILQHPELGKLIDFAQSMQNKKRVLAAQRSLQFAGAPMFKHELKMFNCLFTHIDRARVFQETMFSLLCGCFHPDTKVITSIGPVKISDITVDHLVCTLNLEDGTYDFVKPSDIHENDTVKTEKYELEFEGGYTVKCTHNHEFLTHNRGWVAAKELSEKDDIVNIFE